MVREESSMKRKLSFAIFLCIAAASVSYADNSTEFDLVFKRMAQKLASVESKLPNKTVAVYGFQVIGRPEDPYALYATEKITHELVNSGSLLVIERSRIDEILKEQDFSHSVVVDAGTAARIGKILSVDAVIAGTILVTDARTEFIVRVIQSEKGIILASVDDRVTYTVTADKGAEASAAAAPAQNGVQLSANKAVYASNEEITAAFSGLPGNAADWITLQEAGKPDDSYGQYFYSDSKKEGTFTFSAVPPGDYEIRIYFDWPAGGYTVQKRLKVKVK
jgi:hypothetical protein